MNVGDIVRVTHKDYADASMEGKVINIVYHTTYVEVTFQCLWGHNYTVSLGHFDVVVLRTVEPMKLGSIVEDRMKYKYTRYTTKEHVNNPWVSEFGGFYDWDDLKM